MCVKFFHWVMVDFRQKKERNLGLHYIFKKNKEAKSPKFTYYLPFVKIKWLIFSSFNKTKFILYSVLLTRLLIIQWNWWHERKVASLRRRRSTFAIFLKLWEELYNDVTLLKKIISFWLKIASNFCKVVANSLIDPNELL